VINEFIEITTHMEEPLSRCSLYPSLTAVNRTVHAVIVFMAIFCLVSCSLLEVQSSEYPDYQSVLADGAIDRGWIPEFLPRSAAQIREKHDLDSNASLLVFSFEAGDHAELKQACSPADNIESPTLQASWWPKDLPSHDLAFYRCLDGYLGLSIGTAYFWRP